MKEESLRRQKETLRKTNSNQEHQFDSILEYLFVDKLINELDYKKIMTLLQGGRINEKVINFFEFYAKNRGKLKNTNFRYFCQQFLNENVRETTN